MTQSLTLKTWITSGNYGVHQAHTLAKFSEAVVLKAKIPWINTSIFDGRLETLYPL